jgi:hypothetical protein
MMRFCVLVSGLFLFWLTTTPIASATIDRAALGSVTAADGPFRSPSWIETAQANTSAPDANAASPQPAPYTGVSDAYKKVTDTEQAAKEAQAAYRAAWDAADAANWTDPALNAAKSAAYNKWSEALDAADIAADRFDAAQAAYDK